MKYAEKPEELAWDEGYHDALGGVPSRPWWQSSLMSAYASGHRWGRLVRESCDEIKRSVERAREIADD